jgi:hypothetical protein
MSLENLPAIQRLVRHEAGRAAILKLLLAAERNLQQCIAQAEALLHRARVTLGDPLNVAD